MTGRRTLPRILLAISILLAATTAAQSRAEMVSVDRPEINMRAGASTRHDIMWVLSRGYPLMVVERKGKWLKVRDFESDVGWVYRSLTGRKPHLIVKAKVANIRGGPSTRSRIVARAEYGQVLRTVEHRRSWAKVRSESGVVGWVSRRLVWGW